MTIKQSEGKVQTQGSLTLGVTSTHPSVLARKKKMTDAKSSEAAAADLDNFALRMDTLSSLSDAFDSEDLFDDLSGSDTMSQDIMLDNEVADIDQPLQLDDADGDDGIDEGVVIGGLDMVSPNSDEVSGSDVSEEQGVAPIAFVDDIRPDVPAQEETGTPDVGEDDASEGDDSFGEESLMNDLLAGNDVEELLPTEESLAEIPQVELSLDDADQAEVRVRETVSDLPDEMFIGLDEVEDDVSSQDLEVEAPVESSRVDTDQDSYEAPTETQAPAEIGSLQFETVSEEDAAENSRISEEMLEAQLAMEEDDSEDRDMMDAADQAGLPAEPFDDFDDQDIDPVEDHQDTSGDDLKAEPRIEAEDEDEDVDVFGSIFNSDRNEEAAFDDQDDMPEDGPEEAVDRHAKNLSDMREDDMIAQDPDETGYSDNEDFDDGKDEDMKPSRMSRAKPRPVAGKRPTAREDEEDLYEDQEDDLDQSAFMHDEDDFEDEGRGSPVRGNLKRTVAIGIAALAVVGGVSFGVIGLMGNHTGTAPASKDDGWTPISTPAQPQPVANQVAVSATPAAPAAPAATIPAAPTPAVPENTTSTEANTPASVPDNQNQKLVSGPEVAGAADMKPLEKPTDLTADIPLPNASSFDDKANTGMGSVISGLQKAQSGDLSDISAPETTAPAKDVNVTIKEALAGYASKDDLSSIDKRMDAMQKTIESMTKSLAAKDAQITKITADLGTAKSEAENAKSLALAQNDVMVKVVRMGEKVDTGEKLIVDLSKRVAALETVDPADKAQVQKQISDITDRLDGLSRDVGLVARVAINGTADTQTGGAPGSAKSAKTDPTSVFSSTKAAEGPSTVHGKVPSDVKKGDFVKGYGAVLDIMPTSGGSRLVVMENGSVLIK